MRFSSEAPRQRAHSNERLDDRVLARVTTTSDRHQRPARGVAGAETGKSAALLFCSVTPRPAARRRAGGGGRDPVNGGGQCLSDIPGGCREYGKLPVGTRTLRCDRAQPFQLGLAAQRRCVCLHLRQHASSPTANGTVAPSMSRNAARMPSCCARQRFSAVIARAAPVCPQFSAGERSTSRVQLSVTRSSKVVKWIDGRSVSLCWLACKLARTLR